MLSRVDLKVISMKDVADLILGELKTAGKVGLSISDLAERLDITPKQITSAISALMSEGKIMQKQEVENERYAVRSTLSEDSEPSGLSDMNGCPCFHCLRIVKCGVRQPDSPVLCRELEEWMGSDIH
jgi:DNA-binding transcriptional ArsR family regulator